MKQSCVEKCYLERVREALGISKSTFAKALGWSRQRYYEAVKSTAGDAYPAKLKKQYQHLALALNISDTKLLKILKDNF